jgi:S-(hydroxymethyl)glutathione dehydrogenase/alcohol dehydrogenase
MKAALLEKPSQPLEIVDAVIEDPRPGEVLVKLAASGVCHSDYHVVLGEWTSPMPLVLGHEGAGIVEAVGAGVTSVAPGDHVVLSWTPSCGSCRQCLSGRPSLCEVAAETAYASVMLDGTTRIKQGGRDVYSYLGVGSFAEYTVVQASAAVKVRKDAPLDKAAIVGCAVTTGIGAAINTVNVRPADSVLVIGCGGVGLSVMMGAALVSGMPLIAVDLRDDKLELARRVGATHTINSSTADVVEQVRELTDGRGVDWAFEAIGLRQTIELAYETLAPGATAVVVGQVPEGVKASFDPFVMSDREKRIVGSNYGSCRPALDFRRILDLYMDGKLDLDALVNRSIALDQVNEAFAAMAEGEVARSVITYLGTG